MDAIYTKAYTIYLHELHQQSKTLEAFVAIPGTQVTEEEREELRILLHRIKGGSGFFGLATLGERAAEIEAVFKENRQVAKLGRQGVVPALQAVINEVHSVLNGHVGIQQHVES